MRSSCIARGGPPQRPVQVEQLSIGVALALEDRSPPLAQPRLLVGYLGRSADRQGDRRGLRRRWQMAEHHAAHPRGVEDPYRDLEPGQLESGSAKRGRPEGHSEHDQKLGVAQGPSLHRHSLPRPGTPEKLRRPPSTNCAGLLGKQRDSYEKEHSRLSPSALVLGVSCSISRAGSW